MLPTLSFANASVRDILNVVGRLAGINVTFERDYAEPRTYTVEMDGVTLEQALNQITLANQLFYKVLNQRTIMVINDNAQKRQRYDEQVIKVLRLSHADATEVMADAAAGRAHPGGGAGDAVLDLGQQDAELDRRCVRRSTSCRSSSGSSSPSTRRGPKSIVEVEILEVRKSRLKQYGLDLGNYTIGVVYSPESTRAPATG